MTTPLREAPNPFTVTKAVDFTDEQILATFVDLPGEGGGFERLINPTSPMPMIVLGGKGSGRTHLMRYLSYSLQKVRAGDRAVTDQIQQEGYLGVFVRCEGLNSGRFEGRQQSDDVWQAVFAHYFDLWVSQLVLEIVADAVGAEWPRESDFCEDVTELFDAPLGRQAQTISELIEVFRDLQRAIDVEVNNAAFTRTLQGVRIRSTRGRLVFGIPDVMARHCAWFKNVLLVYLIDEFENLTESQQEYVNTLIREKRLPTSIKVGSRRHGMRTYRTLSAGEENREGSEFELLPLDEQLRADPRYEGFAYRLVARRLVEAGYDRDGRLQVLQEGEHTSGLRDRLRGFFEEIPSEPPFERPSTDFILANYSPDDRPYLVRLRAKLERAQQRGLAPGVTTPDEVAVVVGALQVPEVPLIERANVFLLYQAWAAGRNLRTAAAELQTQSADYVREPDAKSLHGRILGHFKADLIAQLLREGRQSQRYFGLETFVQMSNGLPRVLLMLLKHIHQWAVFNGESPYGSAPISMRSQAEGVLQASTWFFHDAKTTGESAERAQDGVDRLATLMRRLRFSDKPVESSLTTFSTALSETSAETQRAVKHAADVGILIEVLEGQKDKNDSGIVGKFQINPMLCPRYDLPLARRGAIALAPAEMDAIFCGTRDEFDLVARVRVERMMAPFRRPHGVVGTEETRRDQQTLPGLS